MSNKHLITQHLDEPFKVILWTLDELLVIFVPFLVLMFCFGSPLSGFGLGSLAFIVLRKVKGEAGHYFLHHVLYWHFPRLFLLKKTPPSHLREWIG